MSASQIWLGRCVVKSRCRRSGAGKCAGLRRVVVRDLRADFACRCDSHAFSSFALKVLSIDIMPTGSNPTFISPSPSRHAPVRCVSKTVGSLTDRMQQGRRR